MIVSPTVLAESGFSDLIGLIVVLVIVGLSALSKWLGGQKQQAEQREVLERRRKELAEKRARDQALPVAQPRQPSASQPRPAPAPRDARRTYGQPARPRDAQRRQRSQPVAEIAEEQEVRVGEELRREQQRREREELERQQRMSEYRPPESDEQAIAGRIVHVRPATAALAGAGEEHGQAEFQVNLADPAAARTAIIFSEILSRPKALRQGDELWDA